MIMNPVPASLEIIDFMVQYPSPVLEIISECYPLTVKWMCKYGDILRWGGRANCDISDSAAQDFYETGIIFNHSIAWTDDVRTLVAAHLAFKGHDFVLHGWGASWADYTNRKPSEYNRLCHHGSNLLEQAGCLLDFVVSCPLTVSTIAEAEAEALYHHDLQYFEEPVCAPPAHASQEAVNAYMKFWDYTWMEWIDFKSGQRPASYLERAMRKHQPEITGSLSWEEVKGMFNYNKMPSLVNNPALWNETLVFLFTEEVTRQLLNAFYQQHLNDT
jgi:hypothetical protein